MGHPVDNKPDNAHIFFNNNDLSGGSETVMARFWAPCAQRFNRLCAGIELIAGDLITYVDVRVNGVSALAEPLAIVTMQSPYTAVFAHPDIPIGAEILLVAYTSAGIGGTAGLTVQLDIDNPI